MSTSESVITNSLRSVLRNRHIQSVNHLKLVLAPTFVRYAPKCPQGSHFRQKQNHRVLHVGKGPSRSAAAGETTTNLDKFAQGSWFLNRHKDVLGVMAKPGCNDPTVICNTP